MPGITRGRVQVRRPHAVTNQWAINTVKKGNVIEATFDSGMSLSWPYDSNLTWTENHEAAAAELASRCGWEGTLVYGHSDGGFTFVLIN